MAITTSDAWIIVDSVFLVLTCIFTALRMYVRIGLTRHFGADDMLLLGSLVIFAGYMGVSIAAAISGLGRLSTSLTNQQVVDAVMWWFYCELFYSISTALIRLSVAILLRRLCVKKKHIIIVNSTMVVIVAYSVFQFFLTLFQCNPVPYFWTRYYTDPANGTCLNYMIIPYVSIVQSVTFAAVDWVLGILPIFIIWDLNMALRMKISLGSVLSLGILAGLASIVRVPYIKAMTDTHSRFISMAEIGIWSTVEAGIGIIAAGAATLKPLIKSLSTMTSRGRNTADSNSRGIGSRVVYNIRSPEATWRPTPRSFNDMELQQALCDKYGQTVSRVSARDPRGSPTKHDSWSDSQEHVASSNDSRQEVLSPTQSLGGPFTVHKTIEIHRYSHGSVEERESSWEDSKEEK